MHDIDFMKSSRALNIKVAKEKEIERGLESKEELKVYENEIKKLKINPRKLKEDARLRISL